MSISPVDEQLECQWTCREAGDCHFSGCNGAGALQSGTAIAHSGKSTAGIGSRLCRSGNTIGKRMRNSGTNAR
ncbi:hypothetical protein ACUDTH_10370 [Stenotrophomonas pavanii]|uniref:hypothetical protein n=1 Tax=Stenotrophomonas pavanii TaxID=487698 RepID=UPI004042B9A6